MKSFALCVLMTAAVISTGCGATRRVSNAVAPGPSISSVTIQFNDREHGKDANNAVDVWVLRAANEMAHLHSVGTKFDDNAAIAPMTVPMSGTFYRTDVGDGQLRIRLTPDGRDDWTFEPRLTLQFSDGMARTYAWPPVTLDSTRTEVTLSFSAAVQNP